MAALRRAGARSTDADCSRLSVIRAPASVRRSRGLGLPQAVIEHLKLGQFDRPLIAAYGRWRGPGAAAPTSAGRLREARGLEYHRTALAAKAPAPAPPRAAATANSMAASARRIRPASRARPRASSPSRASAGINAAQPRAGKARIAIARVFAKGHAGRPQRRDQVATWEHAKQRPHQKDRRRRADRQRATHAPCRQAR